EMSACRPCLRQAGRSIIRDHCLGRTDHSIAVEIKLEARLERLQRIVTPRHNADSVRKVIAAAVGNRNRVLVGAAVLPGTLVPARRRLRSDWGPAAELSAGIVHAAEF